MNFNKKIYEKLKLVPKGCVISYKELAHSINSKAYRAVGNAMRTNKNPVVIPCYKVVHSNGFVGNYSSSRGRKEKIELLEKDGIIVKDNKIIDFDKRLFRFSR